MSSNSVTVLIVDDELAIRRFLRKTLEAHEYKVLEAGLGSEGLSMFAENNSDLVILDLGLPDMDGLQVLGKIRRASQVPILILSARGDDRGKVTALDSGADDYVIKPFSTDELMARIRTALRHRYTAQGSLPILSDGRFKVDLTKRYVSVGGQEVKLPRKEYDILAVLATHAGRVVTQSQLTKAVWNNQLGVDPQYLRVYVRRLREKIEKDPRRPTLLLTETGVGYRLTLTADSIS